MSEPYSLNELREALIWRELKTQHPGSALFHLSAPELRDTIYENFVPNYVKLLEDSGRRDFFQTLVEEWRKRPQLVAAQTKE